MRSFAVILLLLSGPLAAASAQAQEPHGNLFEQLPPRPLHGPLGIYEMFDAVPPNEAKLISGARPTRPVLRSRPRRPQEGPDSVKALINFHPEEPVQVAQRPPRPTYGPDGVNQLIDVDPPERAKLISGFKATRPVVKSRRPRPQGGPEGIDAMLEVSTIDAEMDVLLGHSKILHLKQELTGPGVQPLVSVGSPSIVSFQMLNSRTIRLVGHRIGSTDLTLLTHENKSYVIKVRVVYDMELLQQALDFAFPDALVQPGPWREGMILHGQTRDPLQSLNVTRTVESFLQSVNAKQSHSATGGGAPPAGAQPVPPSSPRK